MKQQLLIIVLLFAIVPCFSQTVQTQGSPNRATHYLGGLQADSTLVVPVRNRDSIYPNLPYKGRVQLNSGTNVLEYHNGEEWIETGCEGSGNNHPNLQQVLAQGSIGELADDGSEPEMGEIRFSAKQVSDSLISKISVTYDNLTIGSGKIDKYFDEELGEELESFSPNTNLELYNSGICTLFTKSNIWLNQHRKTEYNEDISSGTVLEDSFSMYSQYQNDTTDYISDVLIGGSTSEDGCSLEIATHIGEFINGDYADKMSSISFRNAGWTIVDEIFQKGLAYEHDYSSSWSNDETNDLFIPSIGKVKEMIANSGSESPGTISPIRFIDEGNGTGIVIAERNEENYGNVGLGAIDFSTSPDESVERGATGDYSFATGQSTYAHGEHSIAAGYRSEANGSSSIAFGSLANASGGISTALGSNTITNAYASTAIGYNNLPITELAENSPVNGSPLFIVGNGTDNNAARSNAYVLFNNGNSLQNGIASYGEDYSESYTDRSLVDKEYVDRAVVGEGVSPFLRSVNQDRTQELIFRENFENNATFIFPDREGTWTIPTSFNGKLVDEYTGEIFLTLEDILGSTQTATDSPAITNNLFISGQSSGNQDIITFEQYYNETYQIVSGIKYDGRAYGPLALEPEDYTPLSQVEGLITEAKSLPIELSSENPVMVFSSGGASQTIIESLSPNNNTISTLQFPSPASDGIYRLATNVNGYTADSTGQVTIDANGIFNSGSTAIVEDTIDLRSDDGLVFTHSTSGNKLEINSNGLEYNGNPLVDKSTLLGYVASATNTTFTAHKTAADLNTAYPGVYEGYVVKCPNAGVIYIKTSLPGQWQLIGATTLNP